jgi:hypothetical protein
MISPWILNVDTKHEIYVVAVASDYMQTPQLQGTGMQEAFHGQRCRQTYE